MNKKMHAILLVLFMGTAFGSFSHCKALSMRGLSTGIVSLVRTVLAPSRIKSLVKTSAHTMWTVAKIGAVATVVGNIFLPDRVKTFLSRIPVLCKCVFNRPMQRVSVVTENEWGHAGGDRSSLRHDLSVDSAGYEQLSARVAQLNNSLAQMSMRVAQLELRPSRPSSR